MHCSLSICPASIQPKIAKSVLVLTLCVFVHSDVTANSVHPGVVLSEVIRYYPLRIRLLFNVIGMFFFKVSTDHLRFTVLSTDDDVTHTR